jgi:hypothetical protein
MELFDTLAEDLQEQFEKIPENLVLSSLWIKTEI